MFAEEAWNLPLLSSQVSHRLTTRDLGVAHARRGRGFSPTPNAEQASKQEREILPVAVIAYYMTLVIGSIMFVPHSPQPALHTHAGGPVSRGL